MHLLCHVPKKLRAKLIANAKGWGHEPDVCHAREASTEGYWSRYGYWFSDLLYICKQMSPQAVYERRYRPHQGCEDHRRTLGRFPQHQGRLSDGCHPRLWPAFAG